MVEGFIVSLDSVLIYLVARRSCVLRVDPVVGLQAGELEIDGMEASY